MAIEDRPIATVDGAPKTITKAEQTEANKRAEKKAKLATLLDRGYLNDRLDVTSRSGKLKSGLHGEWIRDDAMEVADAQQKGFRIATAQDLASDKFGLHSEGDGKIKAGDVILMICDNETRELIDELRLEKIKERHLKSPVEQAHLAGQFAAAGPHITVSDESTIQQFRPTPEEGE
jgi:hypothetical protein